MVTLQFRINADPLEGFALQAFKSAIVDQAHGQGFRARVIPRGRGLEVTVDGPAGIVHAYEAAVKCWTGQLA